MKSMLLNVDGKGGGGMSASTPLGFPHPLKQRKNKKGLPKIRE